MIDRLARRLGVPEPAIPALAIGLLGAAIIVGLATFVALAMQFFANY